MHVPSAAVVLAMAVLGQALVLPIPARTAVGEQGVDVAARPRVTGRNTGVAGSLRAGVSAQAGLPWAVASRKKPWADCIQLGQTLELPLSARTAVGEQGVDVAARPGVTGRGTSIAGSLRTGVSAQAGLPWAITSREKP